MAPAIILLLCLQSVKPCFTNALAVGRMAADCFLNVSSYVNITFYVPLIFKSFNLMKDFNHWAAAKVDLVTNLREFFLFSFSFRENDASALSPHSQTHLPRAVNALIVVPPLLVVVSTCCCNVGVLILSYKLPPPHATLHWLWKWYHSCLCQKNTSFL